MNLEAFARERSAGWDELDRLVAAARGTPERLGAAGARRLAALYRSVAADLAFARRSFPADPVVRRLETLVRTARPVVYAHARPRQESLVEFFLRGYWRRVLERPRPLLAAAALLLVPAILAGAWGADDPGGAIGVVPEEFLGAAESEGGGETGLGLADEARFSSEVMTNNIQVTFLAFAGGILACLGTAYILVYNGLFLGAITGIVWQGGESALFAELVAPHGLLELSCISVAAAGGLRLGWAVVSPGPRKRLAVLGEEARRSVEILIGTVPWLVLAGAIEGFVTGSGLGLGGAVGIGVAAAGLYWGLMLWRGRAEPAPRQTSARALAPR